MAKITIAGEAVVITSSLKLEDLRKIAKYRPNALTLMEGEGENKEPVFRIGVIDYGTGSIGTYGAEFATETHDERKLACITAAVDAPIGDIKEVVAEEIGTAIIKLNRLEEKLPDVLREIDEEKAQILSNISVAEI